MRDSRFGGKGNFSSSEYGNVTWEILEIFTSSQTDHAGFKVEYRFSNSNGNALATFIQGINRQQGADSRVNFSITILENKTPNSITLSIVRADSAVVWNKQHAFSICTIF